MTDLARTLWEYLSGCSAIGEANAIPVRKIAARLGSCDRSIRATAAELLREGKPVVSSTGAKASEIEARNGVARAAGPAGIYIAASDADLERYEKSLASRATEILGRRSAVRRIRNALAATRGREVEHVAETGSLFA